MLKRHLWRTSATAPSTTRQQWQTSTAGAVLIFALLGTLSGCERPNEFAKAEPGEKFPGGATSLAQVGNRTLSMHSANLSSDMRMSFVEANSFSRSSLKVAYAQLNPGDDMELPFNTDTCQNCHIKNGRGYPPCTTVGPVGSMLLRHATTLAVGSKPTKPAGEVPQSFRGDQSQDTHFPGNHAEGRVRLKYTEIPVTFSDHSQINVRKPGLNIELLGYSPMHTDMRFSTRIAPSMIGVGLLEAISEHDICSGQLIPDTSIGNFYTIARS